MMSVMPGMGSGTKEESTIETRKRPKIPRLKKIWKSGECRGWGARNARARREIELTATALMAVKVMPDMTLGGDAKSRRCKEKELFAEETELRKRGEDVGFGGQAAEELDRADAVG
jgi:hypothetical protein